MLWLERQPQIRCDLRIKFPWAKSVLVVADNYFYNYSRKVNTAKIARYAWGDDYHNIIEEKLQSFLHDIQGENRDVIGKIYVDTGPVLEKGFAVQAGLGWQGKNTTIIVNNTGSFCFLGVMLLNIDLKLSQPVQNQCGTCEKCIRACPTNALSSPGILNTKRCISYFSIEKKNDLTDRERAWLGDWLYGCDLCQEICNWNKKWAKTTSNTVYYSRLQLMERSFKEWAELTESEFQSIFQKSVIKRLKFDKFRRNILAVLNTNS